MEPNKENKQVDSKDSMSEDDFDMSHFSDKGESLATSWAKRFGLLIFEIVKVVLISLAIILPIRLWLVQPFYVEGASMEPNFYDSEYLIINEISYRFENPQRGEVIIFRNPKKDDSNSPPMPAGSIRIYATNYNILRIQNGMGGLAYSN